MKPRSQLLQIGYLMAAIFQFHRLCSNAVSPQTISGQVVETEKHNFERAESADCKLVGQSSAKCGLKSLEREEPRTSHEQNVPYLSLSKGRGYL